MLFRSIAGVLEPRTPRGTIPVARELAFKFVKVVPLPINESALIVPVATKLVPSNVNPLLVVIRFAVPCKYNNPFAAPPGIIRLESGILTFPAPFGTSVISISVSLPNALIVTVLVVLLIVADEPEICI